jgi:hypothetical protein
LNDPPNPLGKGGPEKREERREKNEERRTKREERREKNEERRTKREERREKKKKNGKFQRPSLGSKSPFTRGI